jgi:hypothetical protein
VGVLPFENRVVDCLLSGQDPAAYDTGVHWRQPVIDWTRAQATSPEHPIDALVDPLPRAHEDARWRAAGGRVGP